MGLPLGPNYAARTAALRRKVARHTRDLHAVLRDSRFGRDPKPGIELLHGPGAAEEPVLRNFLQTVT